MEVKPGNITSEYKLTLLAQLIGTAFISFGFVNGQNDASLVNSLVMVIGAILNLYTGLMYIYSRTNLKKKVVEMEGKKL